MERCLSIGAILCFRKMGFGGVIVALVRCCIS